MVIRATDYAIRKKSKSYRSRVGRRPSLARFCRVEYLSEQFLDKRRFAARALITYSSRTAFTGDSRLPIISISRTEEDVPSESLSRNQRPNPPLSTRHGASDSTTAGPARETLLVLRRATRTAFDTFLLSRNAGSLVARETMGLVLSNRKCVYRQRTRSISARRREKPPPVAFSYRILSHGRGALIEFMLIRTTFEYFLCAITIGTFTTVDAFFARVAGSVLYFSVRTRFPSFRNKEPQPPPPPPPPCSLSARETARASIF